MEKKGSITVFLALILSLLLSLVTTGIQSVQAAAARTQILNSMDIGLYSLFGQYDRFLMKEYDLFFIDGAQGNSDLNLAAVYDNLESYMRPVLKQNSQKLALKQGGFTGYRLATDEGGEIFFRQAVTFMRDTLGSQGVGLLLDRYHKKEEKIRQAEEAGRQSEDGNSLENYDTEMDSAAQKSQEAEAASKSENGSGAEDIFGSGEESGGKAGGNEIVEKMTAYAMEHYSMDITVRELAESVFFMNQNYISHLFAEKKGISFSAFLRQVRISHAKELLKEEKWSVTEVAAMVGYNDTSQFIRIFRQEVGVTPKKYRATEGNLSDS